MSSWRGKLRISVRTAAIFVGTLYYYARFRLEMALRRRTPWIEHVNKWVPRWARFLLRTFSGTVESSGPYLGEGKLYPGHDDRGVGRIFICNHRSSIDIPLLLSQAAAHPISRHDLADWLIIGNAAKRVGTLFVDRRSQRSGADVLKQVDKVLAAGEGVLMFPEGTSFTGDVVQPFRPGAFKAAQRAGAEIVPLGIAYDSEKIYYYKESFTTHVARFAKLPSIRAATVVGEPIPTDGRDPVELKNEAHEIVQALVHEARKLLGGEPVAPQSEHKIVAPSPGEL